MVLHAKIHAARLNMISVVPRSDGKLGFVASTPTGGKAMTAEAYMEYLEIIMAGRAAEEIIYGTEGITSGAGGPSPYSDLAQATNMASYMVTQLGMMNDNHLSWTGSADRDEDLVLIEKLLNTAYDNAVKTLKKYSPLLHELCDILMEKYEIHHDEVIELAKKHGLEARAYLSSGENK